LADVIFALVSLADVILALVSLADVIFALVSLADVIFALVNLALAVFSFAAVAGSATLAWLLLVDLEAGLLLIRDFFVIAIVSPPGIFDLVLRQYLLHDACQTRAPSRIFLKRLN
jgi:hypothetical protein